MRLKLFFLNTWLPLVVSLNLLERNELSRKFKYYFKSVRPISRENFLSNENGTYFTVNTEIQILNTLRTQNSANVEVYVVGTFIDDRLILRELFDRFEITEFEPWEPRVGTSPPTTLMKSVFLAPQTGELTYYYRIKETIGCSSDGWKHPFETFTCDLIIENSGDELLRISEHRDVRPDGQAKEIAVEILDWPRPTIRVMFASEWQTVLVSTFLPSFLLFAVVVFAQWKRRKIQIIVTVMALVCIVIMLSSQRMYPSLSLRDLWLCSTFLHTVFLLIIDLTLPARRVRYTLMVDVNGKLARLASPESSPDDVVTLNEHEHNGFVSGANSVDDGSPQTSRSFPLHWEVDEDMSPLASPILGGRKALMAVQKFAGKTFGQTKVETKVLKGCPGQNVPIQRQITSNSLGQRKRLALIGVSLSYAMFMFVYLVIVFCLV